MNRHARVVTLSLIAAASIFFGMVLAGGVGVTPVSRAEGEMKPAALKPAPAPSEVNTAISAPPPTFADIVEQANPAVVSITSTEIFESGEGGGPKNPFEFFFGPNDRRNTPHRNEPRREDSGGSGFLISKDGYILTNNHVIENADRIRVTLTDDDVVYEAEVVGTDPSTDLALIRIESERDLPYIQLGDSDALRVGDWVIAVGNPYYYEHTVTVGVVSSKGRKLYELSKDPSLDDFIQTDAAINFGNSGGPLLNLQGEVVGVNSAISSVGQGIGFAIPINVAKTILSQLKTKGSVARGYLGINLAPVSARLQEAFGLKNTKGALVQDVQDGLPAAKAGIRPGDVIVAVEGHDVESTDELIRLISSREPGSRVRLELIRDGLPMNVIARLSDRADFINPARGTPGHPQPREDEVEILGITVEEISSDIRRHLEISDDLEGVVVTNVSQTSEAYEQGITRGNIIVSVNREPVRNMSGYRRLMSEVRPGTQVLLRVYNPRSDQARFVVIEATEE